MYKYSSVYITYRKCDSRVLKRIYGKLRVWKNGSFAIVQTCNQKVKAIENLLIVGQMSIDIKGERIKQCDLYYFISLFFTNVLEFLLVTYDLYLALFSCCLIHTHNYILKRENNVYQFCNGFIYVNIFYRVRDFFYGTYIWYLFFLHILFHHLLAVYSSTH